MQNDLYKETLSEEEYQVLREKGTEAPFSGRSIEPGPDGNFHCKACGNPLFHKDAKFESGTGWPSFDKAIEGSILEIPDDSHGMSRVEIACAKCSSHLGHVFPDGPTKTGLRYCTNSVCFE
jgi:peptide-methionine (R)-S-oxide reductase